MSGLVMAPLTDKELERLQAWYLAHQLAEENTAEDDKLVAKLKGYGRTVACRVDGGSCSTGSCFTGPSTLSSRLGANKLRTEAWGG